MNGTRERLARDVDALAAEYRAAKTRWTHAGCIPMGYSECLQDFIAGALGDKLIYRDRLDVEVIARATHAHNNSGVDAAISPLTWENEQPYMKEWHRAMARAALAAVEAES